MRENFEKTIHACFICCLSKRQKNFRDYEWSWQSYNNDKRGIDIEVQRWLSIVLTAEADHLLYRRSYVIVRSLVNEKKESINR